MPTASREPWVSNVHQKRGPDAPAGYFRLLRLAIARREQVGQLDGMEFPAGKFGNARQRARQLRLRFLGKPLMIRQRGNYRSVEGLDHLQQGNLRRASFQGVTPADAASGPQNAVSDQGSAGLAAGTAPASCLPPPAGCKGWASPPHPVGPGAWSLAGHRRRYVTASWSMSPSFPLILGDQV